MRFRFLAKALYRSALCLGLAVQAASPQTAVDEVGEVEVVGTVEGQETAEVEVVGSISEEVEVVRTVAEDEISSVSEEVEIFGTIASRTVAQSMTWGQVKRSFLLVD